MPGVPRFRASDRDRDRTVRSLRDAVVEGRLSEETFVRRVDQALRARDRGVLGSLLADLVPATRATRPRVLVIGRRHSCDLVLPDQRVSRTHAVIVQLGGQWLLADLRSTNGTYLNDAKLCSATRVRSGDRLSFGGLQLVFEEP
jgi:pSer/pThr/pTyr-binding forkhead associated (FHA) protein